jgi:hypothetical protein
MLSGTLVASVARRRIPVATAVFGALLAMPAIAKAVTVTPSAVYINAKTRSGSVTLINTGTRAEDIEISFAFGYPQVDARGVVTVPISDIAPDSEPSAMAWLRPFPRRIHLAPGQRQVVRIIAEPPSNLAPGEFWARMLIKSRGAQPPVEQQSDQVKTRIDIETVITTAVSYRNGDVSTDLDVGRQGAAPADSAVSLNLDLHRKGNAAFIGHMHAELMNPSGAKVSELDEDIAIYRAMPRRFVIQVPADKRPRSWDGYTVRYTIDTDRPDLPPGSTLPASVKRGQLAVRPS